MMLTIVLAASLLVLLVAVVAMVVLCRRLVINSKAVEKRVEEAESLLVEVMESLRNDVVVKPAADNAEEYSGSPVILSPSALFRDTVMPAAATVPAAAAVTPADIAQAAAGQPAAPPPCEECGSTDVVKHGTYKGYQKYVCHKCGYTYRPGAPLTRRRRVAALAAAADPAALPVSTGPPSNGNGSGHPGILGGMFSRWKRTPKPAPPDAEPVAAKLGRKSAVKTVIPEVVEPTPAEIAEMVRAKLAQRARAAMAKENSNG